MLSLIAYRYIVFLYITRLPVTRWVKLSLNFELLVKKVMKFLLGLGNVFFFLEPINYILFLEKSIIFFLFRIKDNFLLFNTEESKTLIITRLPVTRWVKLSLNFELLVLK